MSITTVSTVRNEANMKHMEPIRLPEGVTDPKMIFKEMEDNIDSFLNDKGIFVHCPSELEEEYYDKNRQQAFSRIRTLSQASQIQTINTTSEKTDRSGPNNRESDFLELAPRASILQRRKNKFSLQPLLDEPPALKSHFSIGEEPSSSPNSKKNSFSLEVNIPSEETLPVGDLTLEQIDDLSQRRERSNANLNFGISDLQGLTLDLNKEQREPFKSILQQTISPYQGSWRPNAQSSFLISKEEQ